VRGRSKRRRRPGDDVWVVFRRSTSDPTDIKFYLSNAPVTVAKTDLVRQAGLRWPVETAIEEGKSELGMDHYEIRPWPGWHHHMTLTFLAHHFLVRLRLKLKKIPGADAGPKQSADPERARSTRTRLPTRTRDRHLSSTTQLCGLLLSPQTHSQDAQTKEKKAKMTHFSL
jgi:SRSO17 transposase